MDRNHEEFLQWQEQMKKDHQFVQYMTEVYMRQQQEGYNREVRNQRMNHQGRSSSTSIHRGQRPIQATPQLMNQPTVQATGGDHNDQIRTNKTSMTIQNEQRDTPVSSTPRRRLEESGSAGNRSQRPSKKQRAHERACPTLHPPNSTNAPNEFHIPPGHVKYAITHNLPCFFIRLSLSEQTRSPSVMEIAKWIREMTHQQFNRGINDFSIFIPAGTNRFKFGVTEKSDFLKLWNCKWPETMNKIKIEIEKPRTLPDCCALVVRYVPAELKVDTVVQEVVKSISSAVSFTPMNQNREKPTLDYRFCVIEEDEYDEMIKIGRIAIGHVLLPITPFAPGLKLTYCINCWKLGHIRTQCSTSPRCKFCLDEWGAGHQCSKQITCAQCGGPHPSLSMGCQVVRRYKEELKGQVNRMTQNGMLHPPTARPQFQRHPTEFPGLERTTTKVAWEPQPGQQRPSSEDSHEQLKKITLQMEEILTATKRTESKMDDYLEKQTVMEKKMTTYEQGMTFAINTLNQIVTALVDKKNKQYLHNIQQRIKDFKNQIREQGNEQDKPAPTTTANGSSKRKNESLSSITKEAVGEQDRSMETTDE